MHIRGNRVGFLIPLRHYRGTRGSVCSRTHHDVDVVFARTERDPSQRTPTRRLNQREKRMPTYVGNPLPPTTPVNAESTPALLLADVSMNAILCSSANAAPSSAVTARPVDDRSSLF